MNNLFDPLNLLTGQPFQSGGGNLAVRALIALSLKFVAIGGPVHSLHSPDGSLVVGVFKQDLIPISKDIPSGISL
jgi:hypothetical protein